MSRYGDYEKVGGVTREILGMSHGEACDLVIPMEPPRSRPTRYRDCDCGRCAHRVPEYGRNRWKTGADGGWLYLDPRCRPIRQRRITA